MVSRGSALPDPEPGNPGLDWARIGMEKGRVFLGVMTGGSDAQKGLSPLCLSGLAPEGFKKGY